ncbi:unnamed protein product [Periconia digitata]|uniref:Uncharacterized protein n=1 Tax=Periconia digitata TaxID=1303443 RepID=A0A9W4USB1_9PLEO|nr:unnamed protein product [Periconia digitata]
MQRRNTRISSNACKWFITLPSQVPGNQYILGNQDKVFCYFNPRCKFPLVRDQSLIYSSAVLGRISNNCVA